MKECCMMAKTVKKAEATTKAAEAVKTPVVVEEAKTAEKTKAVKKETKTAAKAKTAPKAEKTTKTTAKKAAPAVKVFVEYQGKQMDLDAILETVKAAAGVKTVKSLEVYVKPEDGAAYYVVNGKDSGKADI